MSTALEVAVWFIGNNCDNPRNTYDGNMKLQKLIYFSQLIHLARTGDVLFKDPIYAFINGSVVEEIRLYYKNNLTDLIKEAGKGFSFSEQELETLQITETIFCKLTARELSELNHQHKAWQLAYKNSLVNNVPQKRLSIMQIEDIQKHDLKRIKDMLDTFELNNYSHYEIINGIRFYYDPDELVISEQLLVELETFKGTDNSYYIYEDEEVGLVIS